MEQRHRSKRDGERGQVLLLFVAFFTVLLVFAAITIDQGLWLGHRRAAQKDADAAARAGAAKYIAALSAGLPVSSAYDGAATAALGLATLNGAPTVTAATTFNPGGCANTASTAQACARPDCPTVNPGSPGGAGPPLVGVPSIEIAVPRPAPALFLRIFGVGNGNKIGARSTACVGSITTVFPGPAQFIPIMLHYNYPAAPDACFVGSTPQIGQKCVIATKQDSTLELPLSGDCAGGSTNPGDVATAIKLGLNSTDFRCAVNTCTSSGAPNYVCPSSACTVAPQTTCVVARPGALGSVDVGGFNDRITLVEATGASCSNSLASLINFRATFARADGAPMGGPPGLGGTDPADTAYVQRDCNNGRVAFVFVADGVRACGGFCDYPVKAFAGVFITGCGDSTPTDYSFNRCDGSYAFGNVYVTGVLLRVVLDDQTGGIGPPDSTSPLAIQTTR